MTPPGRSGNFPVRYAHHACQRCTAPLEPVLPDYRYRWVAVRIESRPISSHLVDRFRDRRHHSATRRRPTDGCAGVRLEFHSHGGLVRPVRTQSQSAVQRKTGFAGLYRRARSALFGVHGSTRLPVQQRFDRRTSDGFCSRQRGRRDMGNRRSNEPGQTNAVAIRVASCRDFWHPSRRSGAAHPTGVDGRRSSSLRERSARFVDRACTLAVRHRQSHLLLRSATRRST